MSAFTEHPSRRTLPLETDGMDEFEQAAARSYAAMIGLDRSREELLEEMRSLACDAPVRKVRPRA